jgi:WD40 repeat protein
MSSELPDRKPDPFKYWAFICYSHSDEKWAKWLHRKLETYPVPKRLVGLPASNGVTRPKRLFPIFRDREELPGSANLTESIERALRDSLYLIVICSPRAVQSKWVDQEIRMFKSWDREDRVLCLVIEGEPNASSRPELGKPECLPESVKFWVDSKRQITDLPTEPIAADARKGKDGAQNSFLKIAAGVLGVSFEDLRQRDEERRHRLRMTYGAGAAALLLLLGGLSTELYFQKNTAVESERKAVDALRQTEAQRALAAREREIAEKARAQTEVALEEQRISRSKAEGALKLAQEATDREIAAKNREAEQRVQAEEARALAEDAKRRAQDNEQTVRRTLAISDFSAAGRLIEEDSNGKALAYLARALRADPENSSVITRLISLLSQRNWPVQVVAPLKHTGEVKSVLYSPDGGKLVTVSENAAYVWDAATGKLAYAALEHKAPVSSVEFSADGKWIITASRDNTAQVWDAANGHKAGAPLKHDDWVNSASFSANGKFVVTASQDKVARIWDRSDSRVVISLQHDAPLKSAKFSPDGNWVLVATARSYARLWDVNSGAIVGSNMTHQGGMTSASFSPDGKWIATSSGDRTARIWQSGVGNPVSPPLDHVNWITGAKFSPDGSLLATVSSDNTARLWEVPDGKPATPPLKHDGAISSVNFSPNGRWLVTASSDGTARVWSTTTGKAVCEPLRHSGTVLEAAFNVSGDKVVTASADRTARIWEVANNQPVSEPLQHDQWVHAAAFTSDNKWIATISADRTARIWDARSGEPLGEPLKHQSDVVSACFASDGKMLLTGCSDGTLSAWEVATGQLLYERAAHDIRINAVVVAPDEQSFLTSSDDHTVRQWNLKTGNRINDLLRHETAVKYAAFSQDGKWIITAAQDRTARIWDRSNGTRKFDLQHNGELQSLALSPDGAWLATGSDDKDGNCVHVWEIKTGKLIAENFRHDAGVSHVEFSPAKAWNDEIDSRKWLLTTSDKTARVWEITSGKAVTEPIKHRESIKVAAFSPDGNLVVTASEKTARIWESSTGRAVADPLQHEGAIRDAAFSPDGNSLITSSADKTARLWFLRMSGAAPAWLTEFATVIGGYQLAGSGATEFVQEPWTKLSKLKGTLARTGNDHFAAWAQWFTQDHGTRTTTPFAKTSLKTYVARRTAVGSLESLQSALDFEPNNALALVKLARLTPNPEQADFLSRLGEQYASEEPEVLWIRAQVLQQIYKFPEAYTVMERAIALDPKNLSSLNGPGQLVQNWNKDKNRSDGWLPSGWVDSNKDLAVSVGYSKVQDAPATDVVAFGINVDARSRGSAEVRGPRFICKRNTRCTIEGWVRSLAKSDLTVALCQFVEPNEKIKEQTIRTTSEWKPFKIQFTPQQDTAAELRIYELAGAAVDVAGINVRQE